MLRAAHECLEIKDGFVPINARSNYKFQEHLCVKHATETFVSGEQGMANGFVTMG